MKLTILKTIIILSILAYALLLLDGTQIINFAQIMGLMGLMILTWQILLGFRGVARWITNDLKGLNSFHIKLGISGFFFVATHYGLILATDQYGLDILLSTDLSNPTVLYVKFGSIAFMLLFALWLSSAVLRKRISWDWWKRIHFLAYVIVGFALLHAGQIGTQLNTNTPARWIWYSQIAIFAIVVLWRFAYWTGLGKKQYKVDFIEDVARDVKQFTLVPEYKALGMVPKKGQFAYLQYARFKQAHPFTVSHFDEDTRAISFSIKNSGDYTAELHEKIERGDEVYIDGPYGVFTQDIDTKPAVLIAGGIGITPFLRQLGNKKVEHLFWGCRTVDDLAYRRDIVRSKTPTTIALSEEDRKGYESGMITAELIKKRLRRDITECQYYICGPPPMMKSLSEQLQDIGVRAEDIKTEEFSL